MINQQVINQLLINLLFAGLQVSKLVLSTVYCTPWRATLPSTRSVFSNLGGPENQKNGLQRPPKAIKMRSQEVPKVVKITKIMKK